MIRGIGKGSVRKKRLKNKRDLRKRENSSHSQRSSENDSEGLEKEVGSRITIGSYARLGQAREEKNAEQGQAFEQKKI